MKINETTVSSMHDGLELSLIICTPDNTGENAAGTKAIVQFSHGMCEHKERYLPFMEYLCAAGYVCAIHDHRGHGASVKSGDHLGFFYDGGWNALVDDILQVNNAVRKNFPGLPLFLFGHSMGSMAVRSFTKRHDDMIDGLIVCGSPSKNPGAGIGKLLAKIFAWTKGPGYRPKLIQKIGFDSFNSKFSNEGPNAWICSDSEVVDKYNDDNLCNYQFTANGFINLFGLMQDCYASKGWKLANRSNPVMFISGKDDPCRTSDKDFRKAVNAMRNAGYPNVSEISYDGMRHEILNERDKEKVWKEVLQTLDRWTCEKKKQQ